MKTVFIILGGILLGFLTTNRTMMPLGLEIILNEGILIVLSISILMMWSKNGLEIYKRNNDYKKFIPQLNLGTYCAIWGLSFTIGGDFIRNIELFFEFNKNIEFIVYGLMTAISFTIICFFAGILLGFCYRIYIFKLIITSFLIGYCGYSLVSNLLNACDLFVIITNIMVLIILLCIIKKEFLTVCLQ